MHTRADLKPIPKKNKKGPRKKVVDLLAELYVGSMKTKVAKKAKSPRTTEAKSV